VKERNNTWGMIRWLGEGVNTTLGIVFLIAIVASVGYLVCSIVDVCNFPCDAHADKITAYELCMDDPNCNMTAKDYKMYRYYISRTEHCLSEAARRNCDE
jgi:hypothetical protein